MFFVVTIKVLDREISHNQQKVYFFLKWIRMDLIVNNAWFAILFLSKGVYLNCT